jgi:hypothetical protein
MNNFFCILYIYLKWTVTKIHKVSKAYGYIHFLANFQ